MIGPPARLPRASGSREASFWRSLKAQLKKKRPRWLATRIEGASTPGLPDVLLADETGRFHLIELKICTGFSVRLSSQQVSFLTRYSRVGASVWILVRQQRPDGDFVFLFSGGQAVDLVERGMKKVTPSGKWEFPVDWDAVFARLSARNRISSL